MPLYKIKDFDSNYQKHFDNKDILGFDLYDHNEKIGSVDNLLVDDNGNFRYFVIHTGIWIFGKRVLLPVGRTRISYDDRRIYADNLSREDVENLPEYDENSALDYDYEERVRNIYRRPGSASSTNTTTGATRPLESSAALESSAPLEGAGYAASQPRNQSRKDVTTHSKSADKPSVYDRDTYSYDREPNLFGINDQDHQSLRLYEERLIADKKRRKVGDVTVGKHVETETANVSVPIEKERVVIERTNPTDATVTSGNADFREGEVARMEVYEEVPDIHKEAYVREQVNVRKEVDRDRADVQDQVRREELDVDTKGQPRVDARPDDRPRRNK
ncbi:MAG TPA: DUF2382 domain-containing protein [Leptolyngbyaceae cyanobacterium M33_DOE_097]|uniref:DUF2382 domain-containing protein n=1 Tax=Oscillatoriales cyanobacterium SpSt-418 TaxID=2282169 RepID=A0A7C3PMD8_9CYAN|nr:DUF2382 domain-containing protein [Leptolyngbyaceae cyanobacterium M33_DOE_097]